MCHVVSGNQARTWEMYVYCTVPLAFRNGNLEMGRPILAHVLFVQLLLDAFVSTQYQKGTPPFVILSSSMNLNGRLTT